jgi:high affinity Mn2+ porin
MNRFSLLITFTGFAAATAVAADLSANSAPAPTVEPVVTNAPPTRNFISEVLAAGAATNSFQAWNFHVQNTDIGQADPAFPAKYSGPNSLNSQGEFKETVSLDLFAGVRLWPGAELHADGLMWQGFGLSQTLGAEAFPNGEAFKVGTKVPKVNLARVFIRQTFGFGGEQEDVADDQLDLAGKEDISRLTVTLGRISVKDIFDNNAYANDPRTQFMSWAFMANQAWDYPGDSLGYTTGVALEFNQPQWTLRYGWFQMPRVANGMGQDMHYLEAWGMVTELERRFTIADHPGTVRLLAFLNRAHMGDYAQATEEAIENSEPADIANTRAYRLKYGFGLNLEQEIVKNVGVFSRIGWSDGGSEAWVFSDVDRSATAGISVKGAFWNRTDDTFAIAGAVNGISHVHQEFLEAGGTGILAGDGALDYGWEKSMETYYDCAIWKTIHAALDYQFISDPAFNQDRGPVSVFSARIHWEF